MPNSKIDFVFLLSILLILAFLFDISTIETVFSKNDGLSVSFEKQAGWQEKQFNDSKWSKQYFYGSNYYAIQNDWVHDLFVRLKFSADPSKDAELKLFSSVREVWVNGRLVYTCSLCNTSTQVFSRSISIPRNVLNTENVLAIYAPHTPSYERTKHSLWSDVWERTVSPKNISSNLIIYDTSRSILLLSPVKNIFFNQASKSTLPVTFGVGDHPLHLSRSVFLASALKSLSFPSWDWRIEGGYPTEFYPLGAPLLAVTVYFLFAGLFSIATSYKLIVFFTYLLPILAFYCFYSKYGIPREAAFTAILIYSLANGNYFSGLFKEVATIGTVPHILSISVLLFFIPSIWQFLKTGSNTHLLLSLALATVSLNTNLRAVLFIALIFLSCATFLFKALRLRGIITRAMQFGVLLFVLNAPLFSSLMLYGNLYYYPKVFTTSSPFDALLIYFTSVDFFVPLFAFLGVVSIFKDKRSGEFARLLATIFTVSLISSFVLNLLFPQFFEFARGFTFFGPLSILFASMFLCALLYALKRQLFFYTGILFKNKIDFALGGFLAACLLYMFLLFLFIVLLLNVSQKSVMIDASTKNPEFMELSELSLFIKNTTAPTDKILFFGQLSSSWIGPYWIHYYSERDIYSDSQVWHWVNKTPLYLSSDFLKKRGFEFIIVYPDFVEYASTRLKINSSNWFAEFEKDPGFVQIYSGRIKVFQVKGFEKFESIAGGNDVSVLFANRSNHVINLTVRNSISTFLTIHSANHPRWNCFVNGERVPVSTNEYGEIQLEIPDGESSIFCAYTNTFIDVISLTVSFLGVILLMLLFLSATSILRWAK